MTRSTTDPRLVRLAFVPPEKLTFDNAFFDQVLISPDGQKLAFTARGEDGKKRLWIRPLDATAATLLAGTDDVLRPFWSPDSRSLAFCAQGKLKRVDLDGGPPQILCSVGEFRGGTWNRAGEILFAPKVIGGLFLVPATGGEPKPVTTPDVVRQEVAHLSPYFLPDGRHYLFQAEASSAFPGVFVGSLDSKDVKQVLTDGVSAIYDPTGWLLFVRNGALMAQPFDASGLELKGEPVSLTPTSDIGVVFNAPFSVSNNGVLTWQGDGWRNYQLVWFDREGRRGDGIGQPIKVIAGMHPRFSPDGERVVIQQLDPQAKNYDVWAIDLARNLPTRLTSDGSFDLRPVWSPDGNRVVFRSLRSGVRGIYEKEANSVGGETLLLKDGSDPTDWSRDGRFIVY
ncbi:MAG: TolB family protein, partial [Blastocatellia bacterium]